MIRLFTALLILLPATLYAAPPDDRVALDDLKAVKIVCDVNVGDAKLLVRRLELIDETYSQLLDAGVTPTIVVTFRGGASPFVTRGEKYVDAAALPEKKAVQEWIDLFRQHGFRMEQCGIAARAWKIDPADILPAVALVRNGYVSIVAYQTRGYALLPMD